MVLTAGVITLISTGSNSAKLSTTQASGGTAPYTLQWYRDTSGSGFTPGAGNLISGATSLVLDDVNLIPNVTYFYKVKYTDAVPNTINSAAVSTTTLPASQSVNQFGMAAILGEMDLQTGPKNVIAAQIDVTQATALYPGQPIKFINNVNGIPTVIAAGTNMPNGYIVYDQKSQNFPAGARCEIARTQSCIWLYSTAAITRGSMVVLDPSIATGVKQATGSTNLPIIGEAFDEATGYGQLIRIVLNVPSNMYDDTTSSGSNYMPTQQIFSIAGAGNYTMPTSPRQPLYLRVQMCGGAGGGQGSSNGSIGGDGGNGGDTTFGTELTAGGGTGGNSADVGQGGTCTVSISPPASGVAFEGKKGRPASAAQYDSGFASDPYHIQILCLGGDGGDGMFNGAGTAGVVSGASGPAIANTGSGGAGATINGITFGVDAGVLFNAGTGGGAGGYLDYIIPAADYAFVVGAGGNGGSGTGAGSSLGGAGSDGIIIVTEYYQ